MTTLEVANWLDARNNFLILTHRSPDGDTIGSGVGLCLALRERGKTAYLLKNEDTSQLFLEFIEGLDDADFTPDFVIAVDTATEDLFPTSATPYKGKVDLALDHHPSQSYYAKETCVVPHHAATGEVIFEIISHWNQPLTQEVALPLYVAISSDTGCFVYGNTTANSHRITATLMDTGIQVRTLNHILFQSKSYRRLKLESMLADRLALFDNGTCAIACLTQAMIEEVGATENDTENISSFVGKVEGVITGITIREKKDGLCKLSMRTDPSLVNASLVCAKLGGGGHAAASGAVYHGTVEEATKAILTALEEVQGHKPVPVPPLV